MSDFDKEAEREKLREKYGDEAEQRETTQQMSELLLQGATMTNRHCDECGDPVFRHQGQEFCPTCQSTGDGQARGATRDGGTQSEAGSTPTEPAGDRESQAARRDARDPEAKGSQSSTGAQDRDPTTDPSASTPEESTPPRQNDATARSHNLGRGQSSSQSNRSEPRAASEADLEEAEASLVRTLSRLARRAEETEDPRAAKDHLSAAREAAEALRALRR